MSFTFNQLSDALRADAELAYKLKGFTGRFRISARGVAADLVADNGAITGIEPSSDEPALLSVVVPDDVLSDSLLPKPVPGTESLPIAAARGAYAATDDLFGVLAPFYGATARVYQILRQISGVAEVPLPVEPSEPLFADTDTAVGRYVYVTVGDETYRVYYEEAGSGDEVLLLQHTAGCDSRQWRHQLADPQFQTRFRMIAYDLPYHGRSLPPTGVRWWERTYQPEAEWFLDFVVALSDALHLERPHFLGCSVGGQLALDLAAYRGDRFGAFFALNGSLDNGAPEETDSGFNELCRDNRVSTEFYSTGNFSAASPFGPESYKREVYWIYRSNFPGVYAGDNDYFLTGHDLTKGNPQFDTDSHSIYLIAGEYDPIANDPQHGGPAVAARFPGIRYEMMEGQSHFAPIDDPLGFRDAILPLLDRGITEHHTKTGPEATV